MRMRIELNELSVGLLACVLLSTLEAVDDDVYER